MDNSLDPAVNVALDSAARRDEIRKKIAEGYESLQRGEGIAGEEFFEQLRREEQDLNHKRP